MRRPARLAVTLALSFWVAVAHAQILGDGIAAVVGAETPRPGAIVLLHSDVDFRARLRLIRERPGRPHLGPLPRGLLRATLDELIGEALLAQEATRMQLTAPSERQLRAERRRLEELAGGRDSFVALVQALGVTEDEIRVIARRRALVSAFLEANLEGAASISEDRIEEAFARGQHPFVGQELSEVREAMRVWLARSALEEAVARWVQVLRARTTVRVLAPY